MFVYKYVIITRLLNLIMLLILSAKVIILFVTVLFPSPLNLLSSDPGIREGYLGYGKSFLGYSFTIPSLNKFDYPAFAGATVA